VSTSEVVETVSAGAPDEAPDETAEAEVSVFGNATVCGTQSEVEITVLLRELDIPYQYRQALETGDAFVPAFTVRDGDGLPLLWEHQMTFVDDVQREQWQARLEWYAAQGFDAGVNLFVTRDEPDGSLNLDRLRRVAEFIHSLTAGGAQV